MTKSRTNADNVTADIAGITAGTGITGGGASGTVTITNDMATTIAAAGDLIYGTANDAYSALSLGTAGQLLKVNSGATAPEWGAAPESGGMTLLSTTTLAGATTTISVSATGYVNLFVQVTGVNQSASNAFRLAINGDTNLTQSIQDLNYTAGLQTDGYNSDYYKSHSSKSGETNNNYTYNIYNVTSTSSYKTILSIFGYKDGSNRLAMDSGGGVYRSNSAVTSLVFSPESGTFSAGTVLVYGVK